MSMTDDDKKEFQKMIVIGVGQALDELILPKFDEIDKKMDRQFKEVRNDISKLEKRVESLEESNSRIERKLDNNTDHQADKLESHEKRIVKVEGAVFA